MATRDYKQNLGLTNLDKSYVQVLFLEKQVQFSNYGCDIHQNVRNGQKLFSQNLE